MKPEFIKALPDSSIETNQLNARRIPQTLIDIIHNIAEIDGDGNGIRGLVIEGLTRVVLDRATTPGFRDKLDQLHKLRISQIEQDAAALENMIAATQTFPELKV